MVFHSVIHTTRVKTSLKWIKNKFAQNRIPCNKPNYLPNTIIGNTKLLCHPHYKTEQSSNLPGVICWSLTTWQPPLTGGEACIGIYVQGNQKTLWCNFPLNQPNQTLEPDGMHIGNHYEFKTQGKYCKGYTLSASSVFN